MKKTCYEELVNKRRECNKCKGLTNPSIIENGIFDSTSHIGPWTR
jgi:hypothetical protein